MDWPRLQTMPCFAARRSCIRQAPGLQRVAVAAAAAAAGPMGSSSARCDYICVYFSSCVDKCFFLSHKG